MPFDPLDATPEEIIDALHSQIAAEQEERIAERKQLKDEINRQKTWLRYVHQMTSRPFPVCPGLPEVVDKIHRDVGAALRGERAKGV
jgi:hypothetical protein